MFAGVFLALVVGALAPEDVIDKLLLIGLAATVGGLVAGTATWRRVGLLRLVGMGCASLVGLGAIAQLDTSDTAAGMFAAASVCVAWAVSVAAFATARQVLARLRRGDA